LCGENDFSVFIIRGWRDAVSSSLKRMRSHSSFQRGEEKRENQVLVAPRFGVVDVEVVPLVTQVD